MTDYKLETLFTSTYPVDSYILKGRLETDGITCFIYDENIVSVNPFQSVLVGGVKLKVRSDQFDKAKSILHRLDNNLLIDENGEYEKDKAFENEIERQNVILELKKSIQANPKLIDNEDNLITLLGTKWFSEIETQEIIKTVKEFHNYSKLKFVFNWKQFWYELLDFEREFFKYLRIKPNKYHLEKHILDNFIKFNKKNEKESNIICPKCNSKNVKFGHAIDYKLDILYLILSLIIVSPFPPFRKKYHCFDCSHSFK